LSVRVPERVADLRDQPRDDVLAQVRAVEGEQLERARERSRLLGGAIREMGGAGC
jgi:hypothetical protein